MFWREVAQKWVWRMKVKYYLLYFSFIVLPYTALMSGWIQEEYVVFKHLLKHLNAFQLRVFVGLRGQKFLVKGLLWLLDIFPVTNSSCFLVIV